MADLHDRDLKHFRRLLRLYPAEFRDRYASEMEAFFLQERREALGGPVFWLRQGFDHTAAAFAIRRRGGGGGGMGSWGAEVRLAARGLVRAPAYAGICVFTLALGVAATTAAFTVLDRVVLRPLPYPESDRLVVVGSEFAHDPGQVGALSVRQLEDLVANPGPAEVVTGVTYERRTVLGLGDPERLDIKRVGPGFFELLGARPVVGRLLGDLDQQVGAPATVVIGYGFWRERFGGDPEVVGRTIAIDGELHTIVGVLSREFVLPESAADRSSIWAPARYSARVTSARAFGISGFARLREGVGPEAMEAYVDGRFREIHSFLEGGVVRDYRRSVVGEISSRLRSALAGVALLLLIACVNVASLMLTRARSKERELSVRVALGAGRVRLLRQLLTEAGLVALAGGALGAGLAIWAVEVFRANAPVTLPRLAEIAVDGPGLVVVAALSLFTLVAAGVVPAVVAVRRAQEDVVGSDARVTQSRSDARARGGLVLAETALAVVVVVGSGLLANDLIRLSAEDRRFTPEGLTSVSLDLAGRERDPEAINRFWTALVDAAEAEPGVTRAAVTSLLPYDGVSTMQSLEPEGLGDEAFVVTVTVSDAYFDLMGIPIVEGRPYSETEMESGAPVVLVNEAFVRSFWRDGAGVGRTVLDGGSSEDDATTYTVVGVVADLRTTPGAPAPPQVFFGMRSEPRARMHLVVAGGAGDPGLIGGLREAVWALQPDLPIGRTMSVLDVATGRLDRPRFYAGLFGGFAALALLLALVGVYGTTAYATRSRAREIGIRMVLGAKRNELVRSVVSSTAKVIAAGVIVGAIVAAFASRAMSEVLLYVTPWDLVTYAAVGVLVLATGVLAAAHPAIRWSRVDPVTTLRQE